MSNFLSEVLMGCVPILVTDSQEHISIRRIMEEIKRNGIKYQFWGCGAGLF